MWFVFPLRNWLALIVKSSVCWSVLEQSLSIMLGQHQAVGKKCLWCGFGLLAHSWKRVLRPLASSLQASSGSLCKAETPLFSHRPLCSPFSSLVIHSKLTKKSWRGTCLAELAYYELRASNKQNVGVCLPWRVDLIHIVELGFHVLQLFFFPLISQQWPDHGSSFDGNHLDTDYYWTLRF